jgi:hypothetical protein
VLEPVREEAATVAVPFNRADSARAQASASQQTTVYVQADQEIDSDPVTFALHIYDDVISPSILQAITSLETRLILFYTRNQFLELTQRKIQALPRKPNYTEIYQVITSSLQSMKLI